MESPAAQRFVFSILPALVMIFGMVTAAGVSAAAMPGALGTTLAILGAIAAGLGLITLRVVLLDWLHLRDLRRRFAERFDGLAEGQRIAATGKVRCLPPHEPLTAPLTGERCAAYHYRITRRYNSSDGSRMATVAQGVHFRPCELATADGARLQVLSLPWMDVELRENPKPADCEPRLRALLGRLSEVDWEGQAEREGRLLQYRQAVDGAISEDAGRLSEPPKHVDDMNLSESWLPVDRPVCLIGHYDRLRGGLAAGTGPLKRGLHAIAGTRDEALARLAGEVRGYGITGAVLLSVGVAMLAAPFLLGSA